MYISWKCRSETSILIVAVLIVLTQQITQLLMQRTSHAKMRKTSNFINCTHMRNNGHMSADISNTSRIVNAHKTDTKHERHHPNVVHCQHMTHYIHIIMHDTLHAYHCTCHITNISLHMTQYMHVIAHDTLHTYHYK